MGLADDRFLVEAGDDDGQERAGTLPHVGGGGKSFKIDTK